LKSYFSLFFLFYAHFFHVVGPIGTRLATTEAEQKTAFCEAKKPPNTSGLFSGPNDLAALAVLIS
ncbi:MAG: hypothetical protein SO005_06230, partial [Candidatus Choladocola sp.]|nr:hypothetical protein [Candidatus Choladocola sp.]